MIALNIWWQNTDTRLPFTKKPHIFQKGTCWGSSVNQPIIVFILEAFILEPCIAKWHVSRLQQVLEIWDVFFFLNFYFWVKLEIMFQTIIKKCRANSSVYKLYIKTRHYTFRGDMKVGRWFPTESSEPMPGSTSSFVRFSTGSSTESKSDLTLKETLLDAWEGTQGCQG